MPLEGRSRRPGRGNEWDNTIAIANHGIKDVRRSRQPSIVNHNLTALIQPAHGVVRRGGADNTLQGGVVALDVLPTLTV